MWLKLSKKYFNEGTVKEACKRFEVRAKQLSQVLTGKKYLKVHRPTSTRPPRSCQSDTRSQTFEQATRHTTTLLYIIPFVHMAKNHCKSIPAQFITSSQLIIPQHSSSIGGTKRGSFNDCTW